MCLVSHLRLCTWPCVMAVQRHDRRGRAARRPWTGPRCWSACTSAGPRPRVSASNCWTASKVLASTCSQHGFVVHTPEASTEGQQVDHQDCSWRGICRCQGALFPLTDWITAKKWAHVSAHVSARTSTRLTAANRVCNAEASLDTTLNLLVRESAVLKQVSTPR